jgi:hypothetical protein
MSWSSKPAGRVRQRSAWGVAGCTLLGGILAGCTTARSTLGTSDSACYLALPTATKAVHSQGRLLGVHRDALSALRKQSPGLLDDLAIKESSSGSHSGSQAVCVAAFVGNFTAQSVTDPHGRDAGRLAVVVSTTPGNRVLGTVIFRQAPLHFGHSH